MIRSGAIAGAAMLAILPAIAGAEGATWEYRLAPYVWAPTMKGDLAIGNDPPVSSDTSILDVLDFAFLLWAEARKGDWGVIGEINYLSLSDDASTPGGLIEADIGLDGVMGSAALAYRFFADDRISADAFAGARIWSLEATIDFKNLPNVSRTKTWVDPLVGIRGTAKLGGGFFLSGLADIGGFGVGSDFQWEMLGRVGYSFNETVSASAGYRHLEVDFDDGGLVLDMALTGPFLAIDFTF